MGPGTLSCHLHVEVERLGAAPGHGDGGPVPVAERHARVHAAAQRAQRVVHQRARRRRRPRRPRRPRRVQEAQTLRIAVSPC